MKPGYTIDQYGALPPGVIAQYNYKGTNAIDIVGFYDPHYNFPKTPSLVAVFRIKYKS